MQRKIPQEILDNHPSDDITILSEIEEDIHDLTLQHILHIKKSTDQPIKQIIERLEASKLEISHIIESYQSKQQSVIADLRLNVDEKNIDPNFNQLVLEQAELLGVDKDILLNYIRAEANSVTIEINIEDQKKLALLDSAEKNYLIKKYIELCVKPEIKIENALVGKTNALPALKLAEEKTGLKNEMQYYKFFLAHLPLLKNKIIAVKSSINFQNILNNANKLAIDTTKVLTSLNTSLDRAFKKCECTQWGELSVSDLKLKKQLFILKCEFESTIDVLTEGKEDNLYETKNNLLNKIELILSLPAMLTHKLNSVLSLWPEMSIDSIKKYPTLLKNAPNVVHFLLDSFKGCELAINIPNADYLLDALTKHEDDLENSFSAEETGQYNSNISI